MKFFLHIGYPKCFSTTLQRNYFSRHPEIHYGGIGITSNIDFLNDDLNLLVESGLIYFNLYLFEKEKIKFKKIIKKFRQDAEQKGANAAGLSSEHLIFNFSPQGIDQLEKIRRIHELFGSDIQIILILRQHRSLIISLYKEFVRMGLPYTFDEFSEWLYKYQDRNFLYDLMYFNTYERLCHFFPDENIHVFWFEDYKNEKQTNLKRLFDDLSHVLQISKIDEPIQNFNVSLPDEQVIPQIEINQTLRYDYGDYHVEGIENHRRRIYFNKYLGLNYSEEKTFENVLKKRVALELAGQKSQPGNKMSYDNIFFRKILSILEEDFEKFKSVFPSKRNE